ncbi:16S rRNA (guanine(966)-N(2))-methyltransferase RsmD [Mycoplasma simbae]|uniref:16S rRNA (guanine(966)-N(2))-methyltransferase RsmD n=1 Tax=Mycoplasma simbae TaxID=36744 RepID=UPI000497F358|nr:16S rRNA (guanine(966)-N(2))-methyltransferase RsmD [Mycoplasma simbae]
MLRVISGKYRRLLLVSPDKSNTRPTKDNIREAIFNTLRFDLANKIVLDLFAGSGAMGIEALSNDAMKCVFVDNSREAIKVIEQNLNTLKINNAQVFKIDAIAFLTSMHGRVFDFIFIDPPYKNTEIINKSLDLIVQNSFLNDLGLIVVETDNPTEVAMPEGLIIQKEKKYGKTTILFIAKNI